MPSDRSRTPNDLLDQYKAVVTQQGRVILDRDFNALQETVNGRVEADALDVIGPCGTPDDGFAISLPDSSPPGPPLWIPPSPLSPPVHDFDFLVSPGTMYVGGERAVFPAIEAGHRITYSYYDQPDWIQPDAPLVSYSPPSPARESVYLHLFEQEVGAVEDPDLLEVALGGPDTTQRVRLMRRIERKSVQHTDCALAWAEVKAAWLQHGLGFDPKTMRLLPQVKLQVSFTQSQTEINPCDPVAPGGYLGADNQLIRVQISDPGDPGKPGRPAQLLWGYDNASFLYRITAVVSNATMLQLNQDPPDAFHIPQTGQAVEILRSAAILGSEPDESDPTGQRTIVRCVAEPTGVVRTLTQPYGPVNPNDPTKYIVLDQPLPPEYANDTNPLFLRVWQAELSFNPAGDSIPLTDPTNQSTTGIQVTLSVPLHKTLTVGAFWMIAVRPGTPQTVYPERLLAEPQPPDGPRQWACPLAVIDWTSYAVHDCRRKFDNLVELTRRRPGCCTVSVRPENLTQSNTLQSIIDRAVGLADVVTVCLNPGVYSLTQPLRLGSQHSNMVLEACPGGVTIQADPNSDPTPFIDGLVVLIQADGITLRSLRFEPLAVPLPQTLSSQFNSIGTELLTLPLFSRLITGSAVDYMDSVVANIEVMIGIRPVQCGGLIVEDCSFEFLLPNGSPPPVIDIFGAGILAAGDCTGLTVRGCTFESTYPPTSTPLLNLSNRETSSSTTPTAEAVSAPEAASVFQGANFAALLQKLRSQASKPPDRIGPTVSAPESPFVALLGCLVCPYVPDFLIPQPGTDFSEYNFLLPSVLQDAVFCNNSFNRLTLAVASMADTGTVRLHDNNVIQSLGGFWLMPLEQSNFSPLGNIADFLILELLTFFDETFIAFSLGLIYPLPVGYHLPVGNPASVTGSATLFITNNSVEPLQPDNGGSSALLVLTDSWTDPQSIGASLIISNNRLRGWMPPILPTVVLSFSGRCAITGNLISDEAPKPTDTNPNSLLIQNGTDSTAMRLTVVGNVLEGQTNLANLLRTDGAPAPLDTWQYLNSIN
jgi:hypothetical protein